MLTRRFGSRAIDELIVVAAQAFFIGIAALWSGLGYLAGTGSRTGINTVTALIIASGFIAGIAYEAISTRTGGGIGKRLLGLEVLDAESGLQPSARQSIRRWFVVAAVQPLMW
ncbi:MAG: RDD family protein, partial [Acidimicrobiales bacterium]